MKQKLLFLLSTGLLVAMVLVSCRPGEIDEKILSRLFHETKDIPDSVIFRNLEDTVEIEFVPGVTHNIVSLEFDMVKYDSFYNEVRKYRSPELYRVIKNKVHIPAEGLKSNDSVQYYFIGLCPYEHNYFVITKDRQFPLPTINIVKETFSSHLGYPLKDTRTPSEKIILLRGDTLKKLWPSMNFSTKHEFVYRLYTLYSEEQRDYCRCEYCEKRKMKIVDSILEKTDNISWYMR